MINAPRTISGLERFSARLNNKAEDRKQYRINFVKRILANRKRDKAFTKLPHAKAMTCSVDLKSVDIDFIATNFPLNVYQFETKSSTIKVKIYWEYKAIVFIIRKK
ncbi:hypothetical protein [Myxosarcina sp. GI1(2024)]